MCVGVGPHLKCAWATTPQPQGQGEEKDGERQSERQGGARGEIDTHKEGVREREREHEAGCSTIKQLAQMTDGADCYDSFHSA